MKEVYKIRAQGGPKCIDLINVIKQRGFQIEKKVLTESEG